MKLNKLRNAADRGVKSQVKAQQLLYPSSGIANFQSSSHDPGVVQSAPHRAQ